MTHDMLVKETFILKGQKEIDVFKVNQNVLTISLGNVSLPLFLSVGEASPSVPEPLVTKWQQSSSRYCYTALILHSLISVFHRYLW